MKTNSASGFRFPSSIASAKEDLTSVRTLGFRSQVSSLISRFPNFCFLRCLAPSHGPIVPSSYGRPTRTSGFTFQVSSVTHLLTSGLSLLLLTLCSAPAATRYVDVNNPNPSPPYTNWATAAQVIQDAVDAAQPGDTVLVTNGVYRTGGRRVGSGQLTNRVAIEKAIRLESMNGPSVTIIEGAAAPGIADGIGEGAVRCVYLKDNLAVLSGFTLTNGHCGSSTANLDDRHGGGVNSYPYSPITTNCLILGNAAFTGGGSFGGKLYNCTMSGNSAQQDGGGGSSGTLYNCLLTGNSARYGGGFSSNILYNCTVVKNVASSAGGGVMYGTIYNCIVYYNSAPYAANYTGAGSRYSCTTPMPWSGVSNITAEPAFIDLATGNLRLLPGSPCIDAGTNLSTLITKDFDGIHRPLDGNGDGVAVFDMGAYEYGYSGPPILVRQPASQTFYSGFQVSLEALALGTAPVSYQWYRDGLLLETETNQILRLGAITTNHAGGYQVRATNVEGSVTSPLAVITVLHSAPHIVSQPISQTVIAPTNALFTIAAEGSLPLSCQWRFNGVDISGATGFSLPVAVTSTDQAGAYSAIVSNSVGSVTSILAQLVVIPRGTRYVWQDSPTPAWPYTTWTTAAREIQEAIDATPPDDLVLVTNGVYRTGGRCLGTSLLLSRVLIDKAIQLCSVNGPAVTIIEGAPAPGAVDGLGEGAVRCANLAAPGAMLSGFTLTNGHTKSSIAAEADRRGGGVTCHSNAVVTNCFIVANKATTGGGSFQGKLCNSVLTRNRASEAGASAGGTHYNCTLAGNSAAANGGAVRGATLFNCIVYGNSVEVGTNHNYLDATLRYCCTTPLPASGGGNIDYDPAFIDSPGSNFHLRPASPCIDAGTNLSALITTDYDGIIRPVDGDEDGIADFDMGAFEYEYHGEPYITREPSSQTLYAGDTARFTVEVMINALTPLSYQWRYNGAPLPHETNASLVISGVTTNHQGNYSVVVSNQAGSIASRAAVLTVLDTAPLITSQPLSQSVVVGRSVTFAVTAEGSLPLLCQWQLNGVDLPGATNWNLNLTSVTTNQAGAYSAIVSNARGTVSSTNAWLTVREGYVYVWQESPEPRAPYTTWATAAHVIQDAVDAALPGDTVLVTNGLYRTGGRTVGGDPQLNRVAIEKPIRLESVNGPEFATVFGDGARCVYVSDGSVVSGFTLTNGFAWYGGGGAYCEPSGVLTNCIISGNSATDVAGGAYGGTLYNCSLTGNSASYSAGGAYSATLYDCRLDGNWVRGSRFGGYGGGARDCTLHRCMILNNNSVGVWGEWGPSGGGGGVSFSELFNCVLQGNAASIYGGGAYESTLYNCTVTDNTAIPDEWGNGGSGGGVYGGALFNCIVYHNRAQFESNYLDSTFGFSCTAPLPPGPGNISSDPQLATANHLSTESPCRGAGSAQFASGLDIDGEPWGTPPSMGADELIPGSATGPLAMAIMASHTNVIPGFMVSFVAHNTGPITRSVWDFNDGTRLTNQAFATHAWSGPGTYSVRLTGYNDSNPHGVTATLIIQVVTGVQYVNVANPTPIAPYTSWETAATNIQDAIGAWNALGRLVLVTNGVYRTGTLERNGTNRVVLYGGITVRSVNGPGVTVIEGQTNGVRCAYVGAGCFLSGFTLTGGHAVGDWPMNTGGGAYSEASGVVSNCVISGNSAIGGGGAYGGTLYSCILTNNWAMGGDGGGAYAGTLYNCRLTGNSAEDGGGARSSTLYNCTLTGNSVSDGGGGVNDGTLYNCTLTGNSAYVGGGAASSTLYDCALTHNSTTGGGGGAYLGTLYNCTLTGNSAGWGGGVEYASLYNCILFSNTAPTGPNYLQSAWSGPISYTCTTPMPTNGVGNVTADPRFINAAAGDFRLRPDSPCINAGNNDHVSTALDLGGYPRILGGTVDMGAHEFLIPGSYPPVVVAQPQDLNVNLGETARLTVAAESPLTMLYQWLFNGSPITAATNATLILPNVQLIDAGMYAVTISNLLGWVTSSNAILTVNRYPVADASASPSLYISANGANATVVFDGSRSSDPDGDPLQYSWFLTGGLPAPSATLLGTGIVALVQLPIGTHAIQFVVSDGVASSTDDITVEVITTGMAVQRLITQVESALPRSQPLTATLAAALRSIERGNRAPAVNQLLAFQSQVRPQVMPRDPVLADSLLRQAQEIIDTLTGGQTNPGGKPHGRFTAVKHTPHGHVRLEFTAPAGRIYLLEASTNLLHWEPIGVARQNPDGTFVFEDPAAARHPQRFYRAVTP